MPYSTVFENHRKSRIHHCERSELRLHWVDKSSLKMPKMVNFGDFLKMRLFWWFSNTVHSVAATACTKRFRNVELIVFEKPRQENERVKLIFNSREEPTQNWKLKARWSFREFFYLQGDQERISWNEILKVSKILKSRIPAKFMKSNSENSWNSFLKIDEINF